MNLKTLHKFKHIASLIMMICGFSTAHSQTPEQFAHNAKSFAQSSNDDVQQNAKDTSQWFRSVKTISGATWDVKRTDSLLTPMIAIVKATYVVKLSDMKPSRDDAIAAPLSKTLTEELELTFVPSASGWEFKNGKAYVPDIKMTFPMTPGDRHRGWVTNGFSVTK